MIHADVRRQYQSSDLLRIRVETHLRYTRDPFDLDAECARVLGLAGTESLLDVGCGPGVFLRYLRAGGHTGRLAGLDQSAGMIADAQAAASDAAIADIGWSTGVADELPFQDGEFEVVSARHMLYHVPDIPAALGEFARGAGPGRTVFAATNGPDNTPMIGALEDDLVAEFGLQTIASPSGRFNTANAPDLLAAAFTDVHETVLSNALVFTEPAPIVRYIMTTMGPQQTTEDVELFAKAHAWLTAQATGRLAALGGTWIDRKSVGLYRCTV